MNDSDFLRAAHEQAQIGAACGEPPFGACVVVAGRVVAAAHNRVFELDDPTAHAEVLALREACRVLGRARLDHATLYATVEPCAMCRAAAEQAGISRIAYGESRVERVGGLALPTGRRVAAPAASPFAAVQPRPPTPTAIDELERVTREAGQTTALVHEAARLTYADLWGAAAGLASSLRERGVGPGVRVAVIAGPGFGGVIALVAVGIAGGAYIPFDPRDPPSRLRDRIVRGGVAVVLATGAELERLALGNTPCLALDADRETGCEAPRTPVAPEDPAYVIYTSGTTGRPKGVIVSHANLARMLPAMRSALDYHFGPGEVWTHVHSPAFGFSAWELWGALSSGARLVLVPDGVRDDPAALHALVVRERVTVLSVTPSAFRLFDAADQESRSSEGLALRWIVLSGEPLLPADLEAWLGRHGDASPHLASLYAATETAGAVAVWRPRAGDTQAGGRALLGIPTSDAVWSIVGAAGESVAQGEIGELCVAGPFVAQGYLDEPDLSAERFERGPGGVSRFQSGDLVRQRDDGLLEHHGRTDDVLKVRGYSVAPAEIELALRLHPAIGAAVVHRHPDGLIAAHLVARESAPRPSAGELGAWLSDRVPAYCVPEAYAWHDALPVGPRGKLDRAALPRPRRERTTPMRRPAETEMERRLARLWEELLEVRPIGSDDRFFDLGGHSLQALEMVVRLGEALGTEIPIRTIFERPTLGELARALEALDRAGRAARPRLAGEVPQTRRRHAPLSLAQERAWGHAQHPTNVLRYIVPATWRLRGELDRDALGGAIDALVRRHEALRTRIVRRACRWAQRVDAPAESVLRWVDVSDQADAEARATAILERESCRPMRLAHEWPLRATALRLARHEHLLTLSLHHVAGDAISANVIREDLAELYNAHRAGRPSALPPVSVRYADLCRWQRGRMRPGQAPYLAELEHWRHVLARPPAMLELPLPPPSAAVSAADGRMELELPSGLWPRVRDLAAQLGTTPFVLLLASWAAALGQVAGREDYVLGIVRAQRDDPALARIVGYLVTMLPVRVDLSGAPSGLQMVQRVHVAVAGALMQHDLPYEELVERLAAEGTVLPGITTTFQWLAGGFDPPAFDGLAVEEFAVTPHAMPWGLGLQATERGGRLRWRVRFDASRYAPEAVRRLIERYVRALDALVQAPTSSVATWMGET